MNIINLSFSQVFFFFNLITNKFVFAHVDIEWKKSVSVFFLMTALTCLVYLLFVLFISLL